MNSTIPNELVMSKIFLLRNQKIMLDKDLAELYQVETKYLKRQVKRNIERFPDDFMFEVTLDEIEILRCQFGTSSHGGTRYRPMAFTEQGVSMLSSVLSSPVAIQVNIQIIRIFHSLREFVINQQEILSRLEEIERRADNQDESLQVVLTYLRQFSENQFEDRNNIGYKP